MTSSPPVPPVNHQKNSNPVYIPLCQNYFLSFSLNWAGKNWVLFVPTLSSMVPGICCYRSFAQWCLTLCDPMNCSMPGLSVPISHSLPSSCPLHQWCHPSHLILTLTSPSALDLSHHQGLLQWVSYSHQMTWYISILNKCLLSDQLGWPKSSFRFFWQVVWKPKQTFWPSL